MTNGRCNRPVLKNRFRKRDWYPRPWRTPPPARQLMQGPSRRSGQRRARQFSFDASFAGFQISQGAPGSVLTMGLVALAMRNVHRAAAVSPRAINHESRLNFHIRSITWSVYPNNPDAGPGRIHGKSAAYFIYITRLPQGAGGFRAHHHAAAR